MRLALTLGGVLRTALVMMRLRINGKRDMGTSQLKLTAAFTIPRVEIKGNLLSGYTTKGLLAALERSARRGLFESISSRAARPSGQESYVAHPAASKTQAA